MAAKPQKDKAKPKKKGAKGRKANGQFAKGYKGGPGNPYAKHAAALRKAMNDAVTEEDIQAIINKMVTLAKGGDVKAAQLVLDRLLGKPKEAPEPEQAKDGQEWREVYLPELGYVVRVPMNADLAAVVEAVKK